MKPAADDRRQAVGGGAREIRLLVPTWAEALPLLRFSPRITGVGRRVYRLNGCGGVLLAGFAGACRPDLRPGSRLLAGSCAEELATQLNAVSGLIHTADHVASPQEKAALGREGVAAVDMETSWVQAAAREVGAPFLAVRVIIDGCGERAAGFATACHYVSAARSLRTAVRGALALWRPGLEMANVCAEAG